ncbi:DNA-binding CsgD family transcriptional regulator [Catenulispora sp. GP43]|uniref:helix-turn-helix transcriptional regulator n=1 Tax=Catenulispora sp. GP43 TaxID=3156263 RepID=UPI0035153A67
MVTALIGRLREQSVLDDLVAAETNGRALMVTGGPGMGKSALLDWTADRAAALGRRVLRVVGSESESELAFATLHQILYPLLDRTDRLPAPQRDALQRALGLTDGPAPDRFVISAGTLALLQTVSVEQPVLVVADDTQWIDMSSAQVLAFVARRLAGLPVGLLAAARSGSPGPLDHASFRVLPLGPLGRDEAAQLLEASHPGLAEEPVRRILQEADGNPLALIELPVQLSDRQREGTAVLPAVLTLGTNLDRTFAGRLRTLSDATRYTLLLAALGGQGPGGLRKVRAAALKSWPGWTEAVLDGIAGSDLVGIDRHREEVVFSHPLVRSALVRAMPAAVVRSAHSALAQVADQDPERKAWHLASAVTGPDESVAKALAAAADHALKRGGAAEASVALSRAAELSPDRADRVRRQVDGAIAAAVGGQLDQCAALLQETAEEDMPVEVAVRRATAAAFVMIYRDSDMEGVYREFLPVLERIPAGGEYDADFERVFYLLFIAAVWLGRQELWEPLTRSLGRVSVFGRLCHAALSDPARTALAIRERIEAVAAGPAPQTYQQINWLLWTLHATDVLGDHGPLWHDLTEQSTYTTYHLLTVARCYDHYIRGDWDAVETLTAEAEESAHERGYDFYVHAALYARGLVAASRGDEPVWRRCAETMRAWAEPRGLGFGVAEALEIEIRAAVTGGDAAEAFGLARRLTPPGTIPPGVPHFHRMFLDLVDSAMRSGHVEAARAHVAAGVAAGVEKISPHHAFVLAASRALAAPDDQAEARFQEALTVAGAERWSFECARVRLAFAGWLRRHQHRAAARAQAQSALDIFRGLRSEPWMLLAAEELRTAGGSVEPRIADPAPILTVREARIAELAAQGMTNKQIGEALHLSPRTVGVHLYKVFPKLGITSRTELRGALGSHGED